MPASPPAKPLPSPRLTRTAGLLGTAGVLLTGVLALMQAPARMPPGLAFPGPEGGPACALGSGGFLRGRFFGALSLTADWSGPGFACDGMQKPDRGGVRLFFAGDRPDGVEVLPIDVAHQEVSASAVRTGRPGARAWMLPEARAFDERTGVWAAGYPEG